MESWRIMSNEAESSNSPLPISRFFTLQKWISPAKLNWVDHDR
jgi:hypothetical protein